MQIQHNLLLFLTILVSKCIFSQSNNKTSQTLFTSTPMIWIMANLDAMYSKKLNLHQNTLVMFSSDNGITFDVGGANADYFNLTSAKAVPNYGISFLPTLLGNNGQQKQHEYIYF